MGILLVFNGELMVLNGVWYGDVLVLEINCGRCIVAGHYYCEALSSMILSLFDFHVYLYMDYGDIFGIIRPHL